MSCSVPLCSSSTFPTVPNPHNRHHRHSSVVFLPHLRHRFPSGCSPVQRGGTHKRATFSRRTRRTFEATTSLSVAQIQLLLHQMMTRRPIQRQCGCSSPSVSSWLGCSVSCVGVGVWRCETKRKRKTRTRKRMRRCVIQCKSPCMLGNRLVVSGFRC